MINNARKINMGYSKSFRLEKRYYSGKNNIVKVEVLIQDEIYSNLLSILADYRLEHIKKGYLVDKSVKSNRTIRLFKGNEDNWNDYIELGIEENNLEEDMNNIVNLYNYLTEDEFYHKIDMLYETYKIKSGVSVYKEICSKIIKNSLTNFMGIRSVKNINFMDLVDRLQKRFCCEIDLIDLSIKF